jgi:hypothetical protein
MPRRIQFKVRKVWWILVVFLASFVVPLSAKFANTHDSTHIPNPQAFQSISQSIDSLMLWCFDKKAPLGFGLMPESDFLIMVRMIDTITPDVIVHGQYMNYRYRFLNGIKKIRKKASKQGLFYKQMEFNSTQYISYRNQGILPVWRVEFKLKRRKIAYNFRFELIEWNGNWYASGSPEFSL